MKETFPSDVQLEFFSKKIKYEKEFTLSGFDLVLKNMDTYEEYLGAREIIEGVSRSNVHHSKAYVDCMIANPLYYPFVVKLASIPEKNPKIVAFFEIYLLPHLGRFFDSRLERVTVAPSYRKNGIFAHMTNFVVEFCKSTLKCNRIDLTAENDVAIRFYEKLNFEKVETTVFRKYL